MSSEAKQVLGLDVGTSRVVAAVRGPEGDEYESQLNAYVRIPYTKLTKTSMEREDVPHMVRGDQILVFGNESAALADLLAQELRRPMTRGILNSDEAESLEQMEVILRSVLGVDEGANPVATKICFSIPAAGPDGKGQESLTYHEATLKQVLGKLGFTEVSSVNEGVAVIYSELEDTNYTGIGVSCGGGLCNVALAYMSVPVLTFSVGKGGDYIDTSVAGVTGELANRVRLMKEQGFHFNGYYSDKVNQALTVYYDDMIQSLIQGLKEATTGSRSVPKLGREVPLVLSGGGVMPDGFKERFEAKLRAADLPISVPEVRLAKDPLNTTAKGALIAGMSE